MECGDRRSAAGLRAVTAEKIQGPFQQYRSGTYGRNDEVWGGAEWCGALTDLLLDVGQEALRVFPVPVDRAEGLVEVWEAGLRSSRLSAASADSNSVDTHSDCQPHEQDIP